jgi:hypothetical protein
MPCRWFLLQVLILASLNHVSGLSTCRSGGRSDLRVDDPMFYTRDVTSVGLEAVGTVGTIKILVDDVTSTVTYSVRITGL